MATGGWQGLVIGRQVKGWEGAERTEVAPGKWERPKRPFSRRRMEERGEIEQKREIGRGERENRGRRRGDVSQPLATFRGLGTKGGDSWHDGTVEGGVPENVWPTATPQLRQPLPHKSAGPLRKG